MDEQNAYQRLTVAIQEYLESVGLGRPNIIGITRVDCNSHTDIEDLTNNEFTVQYITRPENNAI
jgi:hypothetical protein